ncbi:MAG: hypothetical protein M1819_003022 [Sarea resinae]|nr:MAG: hypothetical protein M1819_003022 [Sarea resinae]
MSGRSAYVRKKKTEVKAKPQTQPPRDDNYDYLFDQNPTSPTSAYGRPPGSLNQPRNRNSISSTSSHELSRRQTARPRIETTAISKSTLRAFMDSKSDSIRNKLASKFASKDESQSQSTSQQYRPAAALGTYDDARSYQRSPPPISPREALPTEGRNWRGNSDGSGMGHRGGPNIGDRPPQIKIWVGGGKKPQPWNRLRKDPELWDETGDTLVYLGQETASAALPPPSYRVHSSLLENTKSLFLITLLREGYTFSDDYPSVPSPTTIPSISPTSPGDPYYYSGAGSNRNQRGPSTIRGANEWNGHPTPPISVTTSNDRDYPILHELFFPAPGHMSKVGSLRHDIATRNFLAMLLNKTLVGITYHQAISDLYERLGDYMPPDTDKANLIIDWLMAKNLDDVRNDPASAAGLLAWSETSSVRWLEGYIEGFIHCTGMYSARVWEMIEMRDISPKSKALIQRANLEMRVRVQNAEQKLATFDLEDMWSICPQNSSAKLAYERFGKFLSKFYENAYWAWPPAISEDETSWLTRDIVNRLQDDFGALYDFLVDRDITWDESEERSSRKWTIASKGQKAFFEADTEELPLTDVFVGFDNRNGYPHIPHPFPLVPSSVAVQPPTRKSTFGGKKAKSGAEDKGKEIRTALAYIEATNVYLLDSTVVSNRLIEAFTKFEKTDHPGEIDPYEARKGRWILLYGILQILATVSLDSLSVRHKDDVRYLLNPQLRGIPPWRIDPERYPEEALHNQSFCWRAPATWDVQRDESGPERQLSQHERQMSPESGRSGRDGEGRDIAATLLSDQGEQQWLSEDEYADVAAEELSPTNMVHRSREWPTKPRMRYDTDERRNSGYQAPDDW